MLNIQEKAEVEYYVRRLPIGRENAVHMYELANEWGCSTREVRRIIELIRKDGFFVCANKGGYFLSSDPDDIREFVETNRAKAISLLDTIKYMRRYLKECE